jgi:hypothetical protein
MTVLVKQFADRAVFDATEKTAISVRDGVLEYLGAELGMEPAEKVFTIYRSPATIANAAMRMSGIPLTDEHVDLDTPAPTTGGMVDMAEMIDAMDPRTFTTIAVKNRLKVSDTMMPMIESGKRELSLGYTAELVPHSEYDFEQRNIQPHHLAAVQHGRCGGMCSFLDRKPEPREGNPMKYHKAFTDENGEVNLQQIVEIAAALPEAIKTVPIEKINEIMPALKELIEMSKAVGIAAEETTSEEMNDEEKAAAEAKAAEDEQKAADMEAEAEEDKPKFTDASVAAMVQKATDAAIKKHAEVIEKARQFVDEAYSFVGKNSAQIMRDALATETSEKFSDSELATAFKLLKKTGADYRNFGDKSASALDNLKDKEL